MLLVSRRLLCLAALLHYEADQVIAVPHLGRIDRRLTSNNQTSDSTITSSGTNLLESLLSSTTAESNSPVIDDAVTARLSVASASTPSAVSTSSVQKAAVHGGLESITTVARPTTFTLGLGTLATTSTTSTTSRSSSGTSITTTSQSSSSETSSIPKETPTDIITSFESSSSTVAVTSLYPISYINASSISSSTIEPKLNSTIFDIGWNLTTTANVEPASITTDAPPITTYDVSTLTSSADEQTADACDVTTNSNTVTVWSTIYTTTITWTLPPDLYTPPFPTTTSTPVICSDTSGRFSVSKCEGSACTQYSYPVGATTTDHHVDPTATAGTTLPSNSGAKAGAATITFWTTDKNPAVVYSSEAPPAYGDDGTTMVQDHNTPDGDGAPTDVPQYEKGTTTVMQAGTTGYNNAGTAGGNTAAAPGGNAGSGDGSGAAGGGGGTGGGNGGGGGGGGAVQTPPPVVQQPSPTSTAVTVIIQTTQIVINDQTFTDSPKSKTSTVVVGTDTFVINPSEVIGAGATVMRPVLGGIFMPTATTTTIDGLKVVYTPVHSPVANGGSAVAIATIDGTVFTLSPTPTTAVIRGQTITLGPAGIAFASQTVPIVTAAGSTESAVLGGEMITAIGNSVVVVHGTTITYGPGMSPITSVIDGDTIVIGPSGVTVHGVTLGGTAAGAGATTYEIVGGATITEIGGSAVVIEGTTYLIGAGATGGATTTVIDGQTLTIGPSGVAMSSYTFAQPYATSTVIEPGGTSSVVAPTTTAESRGGPRLQPGGGFGTTGMCIAIGVGFLGGLFL